MVNKLKEQDVKRMQTVQARKERDKELGYKYFSCPYCNDAVRYRGKHIPLTCGKEECVGKMLKERLKEKRARAKDKS